MIRLMTATNITSVPTVGDARRVADVLPGSVLLFGSVAKNKATSRSDIDLLVILDHIDRDDQRQLLMYLDHLENMAYEVDERANIVVIDWPEWESRRRVPPRVEHAADAHGIWLCRHSPGPSVEWGKMKDIRQETTDTLCHHLSNVEAHLSHANNQLHPNHEERYCIKTRDEDSYWGQVRFRLSALNHFCHVVLEESLLALCCLTGQPYHKDRQHKLTRIFERLPDELQRVMLNMDPPLDEEAMVWIQKWRNVSTYEDALRLSTTPETTEKLGWVASDVASLTHQMVDVAIGTTIYGVYTATIADLVVRFVYMEANNGKPAFVVTNQLEGRVAIMGRIIDRMRVRLSTKEWLYPGGVPPHGWKLPPAHQPPNVYLPWGETWD